MMGCLMLPTTMAQSRCAQQLALLLCVLTAKISGTAATWYPLVPPTDVPYCNAGGEPPAIPAPDRLAAGIADLDLVQVQVVMRHGARVPTANAADRCGATLRRSSWDCGYDASEPPASLGCRTAATPRATP